jgi:deoxyribonuclease-4
MDQTSTSSMAEVHPGMREAATAALTAHRAASVSATRDTLPRIGIHTSIAGDCPQALDIAHGLGCNALQIFSASPRMWPRKERGGFSAEVAARFRARRAELGLGPVAIHANYLINLASTDAALWARSVAGFRGELERGTALGADFVILHPGSSGGGQIGVAIENIARGLAEASRGFEASGLRILLENSAGQGSSVGRRLEELRALLDACAARGVAPEPGVCLDTAHLFAAGYEIHTAAGLERTVEETDRVVGLATVRVIHVNDSKTAFGSRVDRHQHIGRGEIGREAFARILNHPRLRDGERAFLLETPIDRRGDDRRNVRAVWEMMDPEHMPAVKRGAGHRVRDGFRVRRAGKGRKKKKI